MRSFTVTSPSATTTERIARTLALFITPPLTLALEGDLGAGKTTFVRGLARGLKGSEKIRVQSPTFALARTYETEPPLHHLDLYRISDQAALEDLGLEHLLDDEAAIVCIEWPAHHANPFPSHTVWIKIKHCSSNRREIEFTFNEHTKYLANDWQKKLTSL